MTPGFNEHAQSRRVVEQHFGEGFIRILSPQNCALMHASRNPQICWNLL
jgi:hypothetical protein